jgi:hypothetical protein
MDFVDLRLYPKNTPPRACNANSLKNWQRVIACLAVQEIYERKSMTNAQKYEACYAAYIRHAKNIAEKFKDNLHEHFKLEVLQRATLNGTASLTGKQIWDIWDSTNRDISNIYLPEWLIFTKGGKKIVIPSGKTLDDILLEFRKHLFQVIKFKDVKQPTITVSAATNTAAINNSNNVNNNSNSNNNNGATVLFPSEDIGDDKKINKINLSCWSVPSLLNCFFFFFFFFFRRAPFLLRT